MLLDTRLEGVIEVQGTYSSGGARYFEATLVSDDAQTLHIYEGQLKEVPLDELEEGQRYKVVFRPFVNNRWLELKIEQLELVLEA